MSTGEHLTSAGQHVAALRTITAGLRHAMGDTVDVRRLEEDVRRVGADLELLGHRGHPQPGQPPQPGTGQQDVVYIPDTEYDPSLWADADDEGIGHTGR
ncbi:MAG TPA: hypothetical protein VFL99_10345 [Segeticoccus sp.]|uniref:hypothetical protein n=1 Tax=Segeticoccus sp. TaxID=2706531 RepID=UPI002D80774D|nr:hypothetical protein [Segeticoccus sp.]HET8600715.1 hypothetical protein [Segeticoccus sp.]